MKVRIGFVAPYQELINLANEIIPEMKIDIDVRLGNLDKGIQTAQDMEASGKQAIISRGGTALIIKNYVDIPVIEVKVTGYDILNTLYPLRNTSNPIGVVGYKNVIYGCRTICKVLNIKMKEIIIPTDCHFDWKETENQVRDAISKYNIKVIIGDTVALSKFTSLKIDHRLIVSGKEAILQAIEEAKNVVFVMEKEKENSKRFATVLDYVQDGVIATDENGLITVVNPVAKEIFKINDREVIGKTIKSVIHNTRIDQVLQNGRPQFNEIQESPSGNIITQRIPILVDNQIKGAVATFQKVSIVQGAEQKIRRDLYASGLVAKYTFKDILTKNDKMEKIKKVAQDYAVTDATVLITGESGTGKELLAQSIHSASNRSAGPFVAINCAALPPQLLESELFGYVDGAFTGAKKGGKIGLFELAHLGAILLDEIGELDKLLQARILRVLQEKQVMRLGSDKIVPVNVRVIAATNIDLKDAVNKGLFRSDLFYRLNVLNVKTIPLRERPEDIEFLSYHYLSIFNKKYYRSIKHIGSDVLSLFNNYYWPGNVRELENILERIVISTKSQEETIVLKNIELLVAELESSFSNFNSNGLLTGTMKEIKKKIVRKVLKEENNNKSRTAKRLGIDRGTLERLL